MAAEFTSWPRAAPSLPRQTASPATPEQRILHLRQKSLPVRTQLCSLLLLFLQHRSSAWNHLFPAPLIRGFSTLLCAAAISNYPPSNEAWLRSRGADILQLHVE